MATIWLDGELVDDSAARLSPHDRGFTLADGVFETLRTHGTAPLWLADHVARLRAGAALLGIPVPFDDNELQRGTAALLARAGYDRGALRITLTRGPAAQRGLWPTGEPLRPTVLASVAPLATHAPVRVVVARTTRRNERSPLASIKTLNYGDNLLARREAVVRGADDALLLSTADRVACATVGNLFVRIGGRLRTPPLIDGALPGLARARLLTQTDADEVPLERDDLARVTAAFVSNSLGCTSIAKLEGRRLDDLLGRIDVARLYR